MGSDAKAGYGAKGRWDGLWFDPEDLTLVNNTEHELFDERIEMPVDESLVLNVMAKGVLEPVLVVKQGVDGEGKPLVLVVDGRQRVRAALEANRRLRAEGKQAVRVPAMPARSTDLMGVLISANELRFDDTPLARARKLARYQALGRTDEEAALTFGVSRESIRQWKILLELHPKLQAAIDRRELPAHIALKLHAVPYEEQPAALEKMRAAGELRGQAGERAARERAGTKSAGATKLSLRIAPTEVRALRRVLEQTERDALPAKARKAIDEILARLAALEARARGKAGG